MRIRLLAAAVAAAAVIGVGAPAQARPAARPAPAPVPYLALGDSLTAGHQRGRDDRAGGYVGVVRRGLAARGVRTVVTNLACTGETTATFAAGGRCRYPAGGQLAQAERFLRAHPTTGLITISLGANDLNACRAGLDIDVFCAWRAAGRAGDGLGAALARLRAAAPRARIVVLDYYNPYLALRLVGHRLSATNSVLGQARLNQAIRGAAADHGAVTARVAEAFGSNDLRPTAVPGRGTLPRNLATICSATWMCTAKDIHPNDTGYGVIGRAVLDRL